MTLIGWIFWGLIASILTIGFIIQKKYGMKAPEETNHQLSSSEHVKSQTSP
ncbi:hypothetical protein IQ283_12290 [Alkalihalobacillus hwajinpoensis]|uniref:hypothetical protein n=1 Tax=Guptibacillus hwajinpoensis TaxID=208199 RepID=UPI0018838B06|nr:hypothetical protein [Pseudalkalibacillus hwajinpoensis]MBF0707367.1 hypothetical protein [Pseudalkalibacillus hwajinpoensis]